VCGLDHLVPPDKHTAYSIAQMAAEELVGQLPTGRLRPSSRICKRPYVRPIYGRVFVPMVKASPLSVVHAKLCSPIPEVEYEARLASGLPPRAEPYTIDEVTGTLVRAHFWNVPVRRSLPGELEAYCRLHSL
jgi:2-keto-4-pentenoate hydratase